MAPDNKQELPKLASKNLFKNIALRIYELVIKVFGVKGLLFGVSTVLLIYDVISDWTWFLSGLVLVGGRIAQKIAERVQR